MTSKIEWTEETWNPVTGCTKISPGCKNCYAEKMAKRLKAMGQVKYADGFEVRQHYAALEQPRKWKKPRRVFVCSMGDLFHDRVSNEFIAAVFGVMAAYSQHTYQILTKRPDRAVEWFEWAAKQEANADFKGSKPRLESCWQALVAELHHHAEGFDGPLHSRDGADPEGPWPLPNVWIGTSIEHVDYLWRVEPLRNIPAAVRFISFEPLLSGMHQFLWRDIHWAIVGCESGPRARRFDPNWARGIRNQCQAEEVPFFIKQMPVNGKLVKMPELDGKVWGEYPA